MESEDKNVAPDESEYETPQKGIGLGTTSTTRSDNASNTFGLVVSVNYRTL